MKWFQTLFSYFPVVVGAVASVQTAFPHASNESKKQVILDVIKAGASIGENIPETHVQAISKLIDDLITSLKKNGIFEANPPATIELI